MHVLFKVLQILFTFFFWINPFSSRSCYKCKHKFTHNSTNQSIINPIYLFFFFSIHSIVFHMQIIFGIAFHWTACGVQNEHLEGTPFPQPWIVGITRSSAPEIACSGALINDRYVLTTAHCARLTTGQSRVIVAADVAAGRLSNDSLPRTDDDPSEPFFTSLTISDVRINSKFVSRLADTHSFELRNDIALIRLTDRLQFASNRSRAAAICLPDYPVFDHRHQASEEQVHIVGYAALGRPASADRFLWHRESSLLSSSECKQVWQQLYRKGRNWCTQSRLNGLCDGGLASALSVQRYGRHTLIGMLSVASRLCARSPVPDMFVDVRPYLSWIYRNTVDSAYCQQANDHL